MYAHNSTTATSTQAVHTGEARFRAHHSLTVPVVQTDVYTFASTAELVNFTEDRLFWSEPEQEYGRYRQPHHCTHSKPSSLNLKARKMPSPSAAAWRR